MILKSIATGVVALCLAAPVRAGAGAGAGAGDAAPDNQGGRFMFNQQADGFIRLDTQTGAVALCSQKAVGLACEAAPEDRALLENEIARLQSENAALKKDILARGLPLPPGAMPEPPAAQSGQLTVPLPSDADIDRVVALAGRVWHRFVDAVQRAQKQVFNKS